MNSKLNRFSLMKSLFSKMSLKLKLLDLLASISGTISECFSIAMYLFSAIALSDIMNTYLGLTPLTNLPSYIWGILAIVFGLLKGPMRYLEQYLNHNIAFHMLAEIRHYVYEALERLSPAKLEGKNTGDMLSLMTADIETLEVFYAHTLSPILIATLTFIIVFITTLTLGNWQLALIYFGFYLLISIISPLLSFKIIGNKGNEQRKQYSKFSNYLINSLDCSLSIVSTNKEQEVLKTIDEKSDSMNKVLSSIKWNSALMTRINQLLLSIAGFVLAIYAIILTINNPISYLPILLAILVLPGSFRPALALGALPGSLSNTFASAKRFLDLINEKPEVEENESDNLINDIKSIKFNDLTFAYPDNKERNVLSNVNLKINNKGIIGIKGPSGNGKSTLLKLILKHRKIENGNIEINNTNIMDINSNSLRDAIAYMEQDTFLYKESLRENMLEAKPDATDEQIINAMKKASIDGLLKTLPDGLDTYIDNEQLNLSTGEKQRIGLARILLRNPKVILLDEPTSNVDSYTESLMLDTFKKLSKEKIIIMVSHSQEALKIADSNYQLINGNLTAI